MRTITRVMTVGAVATATVTLLLAPASAVPSHRHGRWHGPRHSGAVFVQTDNLNGNTVVSYRRAGDGSLTREGVYPTGGRGGRLAGSVVDHTASQGSLAYDRTRHLLYAVNAGSNTITVFRVRGDRLTRLQVIGSGGEFPVSITFHRGLLYVLNARDGGTVQGFLRVGDRLVRVGFWHRELGFPAQPSQEFVSTPGQIAFTPHGSKLVVTTKADGNSIEVFAIGWFGRPATNPVITSDPGNVPFAVAFDRANRLIVADAGGNTVASYAVHRDGTLGLLARRATGQAATCWITSVGRTVYVSNAGSASVSAYRVTRSGALVGLGRTMTDAGTVDSAASTNGRFLYVQAGKVGTVDEYAIGRNGSLTEIGSVTVPGAVGGEGIAAS